MDAMSTIEIEGLLNFKDAAKLAKVSRQTIYNWIADGKLHPVSVGQQRFILEAEIKELTK